jgi:hypothetical protein
MAGCQNSFLRGANKIGLVKSVKFKAEKNCLMGNAQRCKIRQRLSDLSLRKVTKNRENHRPRDKAQAEPWGGEKYSKGGDYGRSGVPDRFLIFIEERIPIN